MIGPRLKEGEGRTRRRRGPLPRATCDALTHTPDPFASTRLPSLQCGGRTASDASGRLMGLPRPFLPMGPPGVAAPGGLFPVRLALPDENAPQRLNPTKLVGQGKMRLIAFS